ncbi:hypothetical protein BDY19DRAFT_40918 [Irpex rosettiformis]|uniref:Uncharacterized protein n=1 Tax=Irpex rosettiformis TaxID=378272 RepID=A0ACB8UKM8_9APHY|nr:hypothetical protein BDY19DRAFT_40918 [Irpex rosettiformis]
MLHNMTSPTSKFMSLPVEVRLEVYDFAIQEARVLKNRLQPSNWHFQLLQVCRQMYAEAASIVFTYVSLLHERQICAFIQTVPFCHASRIVYADVANDGRVIRTSNEKKDIIAVPLSQLNSALHRMTALKHLRVFECTRGLPAQPTPQHTRRIAVEFEEAMFPTDFRPPLESYQLFLSTTSKVTALKRVDTMRMKRLRLSGNCSITPNAETSALREVHLEGVTGNFFDRRDLNGWCRSSSLIAFVYTLEDRLGFELRDHHLLSLAYGPGRHLRKLVLLGCSCLTLAALTESLQRIQSLEYLALSITTVAEQRADLLAVLPSSLSVFKIANARYAIPTIEEERTMCDALESRLRVGDWRLKILAAHISPPLMEDGRQERWEILTSNIGCKLWVGCWEDLEVA